MIESLHPFRNLPDVSIRVKSTVAYTVALLVISRFGSIITPNAGTLGTSSHPSAASVRGKGSHVAGTVRVRSGQIGRQNMIISSMAARKVHHECVGNECGTYAVCQEFVS